MSPVSNQTLACTPMYKSGEENGYPFQYSCLRKSVDRGALWAAMHEVAQSQTWLKLLNMHACIGEGNGNPLQYSCLENPRDRGAWWAAVHGVAQSQTRLHRLSSSSVQKCLCKSGGIQHHTPGYFQGALPTCASSNNQRDLSPGSGSCSGPWIDPSSS